MVIEYLKNHKIEDNGINENDTPDIFFAKFYNYFQKQNYKNKRQN